MKKILITGMSGLIGGILRRHLEAVGGYELTARNRRAVAGGGTVRAGDGTPAANHRGVGGQGAGRIGAKVEELTPGAAVRKEPAPLRHGPGQDGRAERRGCDS